MKNIPTIKISLFLIILLIINNIFAQQVSLKWNDYSGDKNYRTPIYNGELLYFDGAVYNYEKYKHLPIYIKKIKIDNFNSQYKAVISNENFREIDFLPDSLIFLQGDIRDKIIVNSEKYIDNKESYQKIEIIPVRKNTISGKYELMINFSLELIEDEAQITKDINPGIKKRDYAENSVLSKGIWYKLSVNKTGLCKISYSDLEKAGINISDIKAKTIRIFGNGGAMLSEKNTDFRYDDLVENSIYVEGETDGNFGKNDFIVFYAKGPDVWYYDTTETRFEHKKNLYSDYSYYFLNFNSTEGKRVEKADFETTNPDFVVESFNDFDFYEKDNVNLIKSGKEWYGEIFDIITNYSFGFSFADIDKNTDIDIKIAVAARSTAISSFRYVVNGNIFSQSVSSIPPNSYNYDYAKNATGIFKFKTTSDNINLTINYDNSASGSIGWLNYIELNLKRNLIFRNGQLSFRDAASVGKNNVAEFKIKNATSNLNIWDVSDINNVKSIKGTLSNNVLSFVQPTSLLKEFVAFDNTSFYTPEIMGQVQNQNLHSLKNIDLVIVSYKDYLAEAERLAELHKKYDSLSVVIVTPQEIYNEFSSGAQDISAIRDFMKMLYDRAANQDEAPKYLLLFGSASYDYKSRMKNNKNLVPTYESNVSLLPTSSYVTDDYYGLLDDNEGENSNGDLDLGIGRFPVNTIQQAKEAVDKVYRYYANNFLPAAKSSTDNIIPNLADWRNVICFVADDEDSNLHISQSEQLAINLENNYKQFNIDKIYFDSYKQISTPGGQRYPEVNAAINQRMEKGALLINYTGHGGEVGWAHERVLEISDINNWTNTYNMPVFLTATCEFSRFDDPERTSAGEYVYLNSNGGAIALFTTTRLAYSNSNYTLNRNFFENAFKKVNNKFYTMGDIIRQAKVLSGSTIYIRNFVLLGDPVLRMAIPEYKVITDSVNHKPVNLSISDSLKAMSAVSISGKIIDQNGMLADKFNGVVYPLIYDKAATISTLANDAASFVKNFQIQKNIIYKGVIPVVNGLFSFDFIVPKDIMYNFGNGKISYYATDSVRDANGYYDNIIIGGSLTDNIADTKGPDIKLFIDNESFVSGGNTGVNPLLIVHIEDQSGVNMTGNGIGHDITAFLNNTSQQEIVLNDYYHYDLGTYKKGKINYKFSGLSEGLHSLTLKVWDIYNNSNTASIDFYVMKSLNTYAYPNLFSYSQHTKLNFRYEHNFPIDNENIRLQISIFNLTGTLIKSLDASVLDVYYDNKYISELSWDCKGDNNNKLLPGMYIFRLKASNSSGFSIEKSNKFVISD